ncbi:MAG: hypothetical protein AB9Q19_00420 [Candidatus Reddybacter sp.]
MPSNSQKNSVVPFSFCNFENQKTEKASPETAAAAFAAIRADLDGDPMAAVWNDKLTTTQKRGLWIVAGHQENPPTATNSGYWLKWRFFTERERYNLRKAISTFAGLAVRIKGAVA